MRADYNEISTDEIIRFASYSQVLKAKFDSLPYEERLKITKEREDRKERTRVEWFINQGKCPYCGEKLKRGKKNKEHIRIWQCIKCNINLNKY